MKLSFLYVGITAIHTNWDEAVKQQILSEKSNNQLGLVSCNESWGLIYMATCRFEEAAKAYESCISLLKTMDREYMYILQVKELENKASQLRGLIILSGILLLYISLFIWYLTRIKKLKDILLKEEIALKQTNQDLQVAKEKAENAEKTKSNFVANISHEIRTPLNAIASFAALLKESSSDERVKYIQIINNNSDLLLNLISDVLNLSRLSDTNFTLNIQLVNLEECCQHALYTVKCFISPHVEVLFSHPEKPFEMNTDSLRLQQLLVNLLSNAAKFTEKGEIVLDYKVDKESSSVQFSMSDTGCGIPLEKQEFILGGLGKTNEFKQETGLGLSICQAIAKRFGGRLSIDHTYTLGARFIFTMPLENNTDK